MKFGPIAARVSKSNIETCSKAYKTVLFSSSPDLELTLHHHVEMTSLVPLVLKVIVYIINNA